ncbi:hypothetical protein [Methanobrevibacter arboriphilus]|uniref:hypothetical protein n=1 Tax=Methanobrevibacter arboriphilus TaxID=39441 RepID=UPI000A7723EA|nr:hypothetical protein [Methanobrevibacter arboriphilus]
MNLKKENYKENINAAGEPSEDLNEKDLTFSVTKITPGEIIARSGEFQTYFEGDVTEKAIELGWIKTFPGRGQWFYGPQMTALQRAFEKNFNR